MTDKKIEQFLEAAAHARYDYVYPAGDWEHKDERVKRAWVEELRCLLPVVRRFAAIFQPEPASEDTLLKDEEILRAEVDDDSDLHTLRDIRAVCKAQDAKTRRIREAKHGFELDMIEACLRFKRIDDARKDRHWLVAVEGWKTPAKHRAEKQAMVAEIESVAMEDGCHDWLLSTWWQSLKDKWGVK